MYTAQIGREFLELFIQKTEKNISAKEFFDKEFFPVMFNSEDQKHLMHVHGSPFFQPSYKRLAQKEKIPIPAYRKEKFEEALQDIDSGKIQPHGGIGVGFMAGGMGETTSGQVSSIDIGISEESILYSWFGGALGVGFGGGYDFLFSNPELQWFLYRGWKYYRKYLNETPKAKGRQIETWNGLWLIFGLRYKDDLERAYQETINGITNFTGKQGKYIRLNRPNWSDQVFSLAKYLDDQSIRELVYGYGYGQTNTTLGFLYIELKNVRRIPDIFDQLIQKDQNLSRKEATRLEDVYKTRFKLEDACSMGGIGVKALQPKDLYKYTAGSRKEEADKMYKLNKEKKRITFITYITWIQAMLNNEDTLKLSEEVAEALLKFEGEENRLRTRIKQVEGLWESRNRQQFINGLSSIIEEDKTSAEPLDKAVEQLMTSIPQDMFKLFLTLIKFKYNYYQSN